jgi:hypothetical protein
MDRIGLLFSKAFHDYNSLKFVHNQGLKIKRCKFDHNIFNMMQNISKVWFSICLSVQKLLSHKNIMYFSNKIP